jgi:hypothetical protein
MIARIRFSSHPSIHIGTLESSFALTAEEKEVEAEAGVPFPATAHVAPIGIPRLGRMDMANGI